MAITSIDLVYRGREYRIAEARRDSCARITFASDRSMPFTCDGCDEEIRRGTRVVLVGIHGMHPSCAIRAGLLVEMPAIQRPGYREGLT